MRKIVIALAVLVLSAIPLFALEPASDPALATVRIKSHGASATVIATTTGRSWLLSCAHMFTDKSGNPSAAMRGRKLYIDGPTQTHAIRKLAPGPARLLTFDYQADLSLLVIDNGPFHYLPVAAAGFRPGKNLYSAGYDNMAWPVTIKPATILVSQGDTTFTRERPWHGRSGGGLSDRDARVLIGVVQGYEVAPWGKRGLYVSHQAILRFLKTVKWEGAEGTPPGNALRQPFPRFQPQLLPCPT